jgi:hypothetical protein
MKLTVAFIFCTHALDNVVGKAFLQQEAAKAAVAKSIDVPPISTTMQCVINLTVQYFLVYTSLAIVRTMNQVSKPVPASAAPESTQKGGGWFGGGSKKESTASPAPTPRYAFAQEVLQAAALTVNYAPMLCVLFLGARMRALQLTQGDPEKYNLPQPWVKFAMQLCAWSVVVQTLMVLFMPILTGGKPKVDADGTPTMEAEGATGYVLTFIRYGSMAAMYGGFTTVCAGAIAMRAPEDGPYGGVAPPVSPAVQCTMNLCAQYFAVYLGIALLQTYHNFNPKTAMSEKLAGVLQMAVNTVNFAPMLCILFIGARMRALQLDPVNGNPQPWAQTCFYICAYAVLVQLLAIFTVPLLLSGKLAHGTTEGDVTFEMENPTLLMVMNVVRFAAMFALYGGFTAVIYSVCVIEAPSGPTPPVSPTMQCVMNLTVQYFFVYLMLWVLVTTKQFMSSGRAFLDVAIPTLDSARMTVMFCPMLSVLFVGTRMRALQISSNAGSPPWWTQQAMFLCTYAVLLQVCMVLLLPFFTGGAPKMDEDGNVQEPSGSPALVYTVLAARWIALAALYGGVITVVCGLFLMDKANTMDTRNSGLLPPPPGLPSF